MAQQIRVTLHWVQILDKLEPFYKDRGEFRFYARVTGDSRTQESQFPEEGHYEISDHPAWNKLELDQVIFEGDVESKLTVELNGEELDFLSANDQLDAYKREFSGDPSGWLGIYGPGDESQGGSQDPEDMSNWRVRYKIEAV
jgi:hypothetical protein